MRPHTGSRASDRQSPGFHGRRRGDRGSRRDQTRLEELLDIDLTPSPALMDQEKPVNVVWNGAARKMSFQDGKLHLAATGYKPRSCTRTESSPAPSRISPSLLRRRRRDDFPDPGMAKLCREKADAFIEGGAHGRISRPACSRTHPSGRPRCRSTRSSLSGVDDNRVTASLAARLPFRISTDRIVIDGKAFPARDAALQ